MVTMLKNKCTREISFILISLLLFYIARNLFYTIGEVTYQSPLILYLSTVCLLQTVPYLSSNIYWLLVVHIHNVVHVSECFESIM